MSALRVGLTGGIASGKSTVGRLLAEEGFVVTDADRLVAELYRPGEPGSEAVRELFGADYLDADGAVDRGALGELVFADAEARRALEAVIHPLVGRRYAEILQRTEGALVFEVPLLVETGGGGRYDVVITVEAPVELRLRRAVERGLDRQEAAARIAAQASSEERIAAADYVIHNDGSLETLRSRVHDIAEELRRRSADS